MLPSVDLSIFRVVDWFGSTTRSNRATPATQIRLTPFPVLAAIMGMGYLAGDPIRTNGASFDLAKDLAPMEFWGVVFMSGAIVLTVTLAAQSRVWTSAALIVGGAIYMWWGFLLGYAALNDPASSANAWAAYTALGMCHHYAAWRVGSGRIP